MKPVRGATDAPIVTWAPALLLRKRSGRSMQQFFQRIRDRITKAGEATVLWDDLSENLDPDAPDWNGEPRETRQPPQQRYYLPLAANEEQLQILHRITGERGVLVQGPPGTGKSHTIANLICHLLATQQRVLVTAQTPRALRVLQEKLPSSIRPLCISVLGSAQEDRRALEESVHGILEREGRWNQMRADQETGELERSLEALEAERALRERDLREMRESDSHAHTVADGAYVGTAKQIAERVDGERERIGWIEDPVDPSRSAPLGSDELRSLVGHLRTWTPEKERDLGLWWVSADDGVPDRTEFEKLVVNESEARDAVSYAPDQEIELLLGALSDDEIERLLDALSSVQAQYQVLCASGPAWQSNALVYALESGALRWEEVLAQSARADAALRDTARRADERLVTLPTGMDEQSVLVMARDLAAHLGAGGGLGVGPFRPGVVRRTAPVWRQAQVDGRPCSGAAEIADLIETLEARRVVARLASIWAEIAPLQAKTLASQVAEVRDRARRLRQSLNTYEAIMELQARARSLKLELGALRWSAPGEWTRLGNGLRRRLAGSKLTAATARFDALDKVLRPSGSARASHPVMDKLRAALRDRKVAEWGACLTHLSELDGQRREFDACVRAAAALADAAPILAKRLKQEAHGDTWLERALVLSEAWNHARARTWSQRLAEPGRTESLREAIKRLDGRISSVTAELASKHAWASCFKRMSQAHRRHLIAWQQAIRKLGKGTGKYAPKWRREAQQALDKCRDAIPGWVMPLHVLYSTVDPSAEMFDVIVVDEASQCGPESLPLMFLGKRIIVVGDDKQISPDAVGVNQE
ncbi:MAG: AAA family ATPase, partial [Myxococcales bacterium]|nr:AAA family ATPase [Myxococcales bacterium]